MLKYRKLNPSERQIAISVFQTSINFDNVYIANKYLPFNDKVPVTLMSSEKSAVGRVFVRYWYAIYWADGFTNGAIGGNSVTLIHELTHVWQGQHGIPYGYMVNSMIAQGKAIVSSADRNSAYDYDPNNYKNWRDYNVEQQGKLVQDWYSPITKDGGGNQSISDLRFPYIEKVVRAGNPNADYSAPVRKRALVVGDPIVFEAQTILVKWGYGISIDGQYGKNTKNAITDFQKNNGLNADGILGRNTIIKLRQMR
jgi:hypothetical protein